MGFYPLPHQLRQGGKTVSWYHGPLSTGSPWKSFPEPAQSSDSLLRYYSENGMFDVSYAAAWELGRLLALQNVPFSNELYQWKRHTIKAKRKRLQQLALNTTHLLGANRDSSQPPLPAAIELTVG
jgi:hypothetical protein